MPTRVSRQRELILEAFRRVPLLAAWGEEDLARLASSAGLWRFAKGELICSEADRASHFSVLASGATQSTRTWANGKHMIAAIFQPPALLQLNAAVDGLNEPWTISAREEALVVLTPRKIFVDIVRADAEKAFDLACYLTFRSRIEYLGLQIERMGSQRKDLAAKLYHLARQASFYPSGASEAPDRPTLVAATQDDIAAMMNASRQTVNRIMAPLLRNGTLKREGNKIRIVNFMKFIEVLDEGDPVTGRWRAEILEWHERFSHSKPASHGVRRGASDHRPPAPGTEPR